jgi:hypothetical protein
MDISYECKYIDDIYSLHLKLYVNNSTKYV